MGIESSPTNWTVFPHVLPCNKLSACNSGSLPYNVQSIRGQLAVTFQASNRCRCEAHLLSAPARRDQRTNDTALVHFFCRNTT